VAACSEVCTSRLRELQREMLRAAFDGEGVAATAVLQACAATAASDPPSAAAGEGEAGAGAGSGAPELLAGVAAIPDSPEGPGSDATEDVGPGQATTKALNADAPRALVAPDRLASAAAAGAAAPPKAPEAAAREEDVGAAAPLQAPKAAASEDGIGAAAPPKAPKAAAREDGVGAAAAPQGPEAAAREDGDGTAAPPQGPEAAASEDGIGARSAARSDPMSTSASPQTAELCASPAALDSPAAAGEGDSGKGSEALECPAGAAASPTSPEGPSAGATQAMVSSSPTNFLHAELEELTTALLEKLESSADAGEEHHHILSQISDSRIATKVQDALKLVDVSSITEYDGLIFSHVWLVVGGGDTGGIRVRQGQGLSSPVCPGGHLSRLLPGTLIQQCRLVGNRLRYLRLTGTGPISGWVSTRAAGKHLVFPLSLLPGKLAVAPQQPRGAGRLDEVPTPGGLYSCTATREGKLDALCSCSAGSVIVPMGQYCLTATLLNEQGWRQQAMPLDWCAANFRVWKHMLADDFKTLLQPRGGGQGEAHPYNAMFFPDVAMFIHQGGWANANVERRVERLRSVLAQRRAVGVAIYIEGWSSCVQTRDEVVSDVRDVLNMEHGFRDIVLVWIGQTLADPPAGEWLEACSGERLSVLLYSPSRTVDYHTSLSPTDSTCLARLLNERLPNTFTLKAEAENSPEEEDAASESTDSAEDDVAEHWNDVFDETPYWRAASERQGGAAAGSDAASKAPTLQGLQCEHLGGLPAFLFQRSWQKCKNCGRRDGLIFGPVTGGFCSEWDGIVYCHNCWMQWQRADMLY